MHIVAVFADVTGAVYGLPSCSCRPVLAPKFVWHFDGTGTVGPSSAPVHPTLLTAVYGSLENSTQKVSFWVSFRMNKLPECGTGSDQSSIFFLEARISFKIGARETVQLKTKIKPLDHLLESILNAFKPMLWLFTMKNKLRIAHYHLRTQPVGLKKLFRISAAVPAFVSRPAPSLCLKNPKDSRL
jgi:hypothetical protein